jgi:hypothetical protein
MPPRSPGRAPLAILAAVFLLAALPRPVRAEAETELEIRAASTEYRFVDLNRSFDSGLVFDALYTGEPGMDEVHVGLGYDLSSSERSSVIPIVYAGFGRQYGQRGATLGALIYVERDKARFQCFLGHFFPVRGEVSAYTFVDTLDWTRVVRSFEVGASASAYEYEGEIVKVLGPVLKWNDRQGTWAASARFGDDSELRVVRSLAF